MAALANADVLTDADVIVEETTRAEAEAMGALAFFGDKYGERVRVVRAGPHSIELCGGTHVGALGMIGPITVVSEASIGSNTRRIEAVTGAERLRADRARARASWPRPPPCCAPSPSTSPRPSTGCSSASGRREKALEQARSRELQSEAVALAARAADGVVVARRDGLSGPPAGPGPGRPGHRRPPCRGARGQPRRGQAPLAVSVDRDGGDPVTPGELVKQIAPLVGGGGGGSPEMAVAGGKDPAGIDRALDEARRALAGG